MTEHARPCRLWIAEWPGVYLGAIGIVEADRPSRAVDRAQGLAVHAGFSRVKREEISVRELRVPALVWDGDY